MLLIIVMRIYWVIRKGENLSDEQLIKDIFQMHKRWVDEGLEQSKAYAEDCDFKSMLQNFYKATLALKGLESVFTREIPEVRAYTEQKKQEIVKKDIPELVDILKQKCKISP